MSLNAALNATVALIEGRTDIAKELIRAPGSDVKDVPAIVARLDRAVAKTAARALRNALLRTLAIRPDPLTLANATSEEAFYLGVNATELVLEKAAENLEN